MTHTTVKLSQLRLSPLNVRKVKPQQIDQLAADIAAHGLLQNLIVYREDRKYYVAAGGRRYRALKALQKAKTLCGTHAVPMDERGKDEAVELSLAENAQREDMHPADAVRAYGKLLDDGMEPGDIAARFGVAISYVRKVLRLAALHEDALAAFAKDKIGMETAQALTLTENGAKQIEALNQYGNSAHQIRRFLTQETIASDHRYFVFVGHESYAEAGGSMTADLFADDGEGYANDPELVLSLADAKLQHLAEDLRSAGWPRVETGTEKPEDFYNLNRMHEAGSRAMTGAEDVQRTKLEEAREARIAEPGEDGQWNDAVVRDLDRQLRDLETGLQFFTEEQRQEGYMLVTIGHNGHADMSAIRTKKTATAQTGADGVEQAKPDYSGALVETLSKIKTLAVQEAVSHDPALALDIVLDCLAGQLVHDEPSYHSPLALRTEGFNAFVPDEFIAVSTIEPVERLGAAQLAAIPAEDRLAYLRTLPADEKEALLALLVAGQINGTMPSNGGTDQRNVRFEQIAMYSRPDMAEKWEAPLAFYEKLRKPVLLKLLEENVGEGAAENCAKMTKADLAAEVAQRMSGRGWIPAPLAIAAMQADEPEAERPEALAA
ncbi:hypothetical protein A9995_14055 [Erythrobacter sp. QSSC1-22B]|uniref:ParB/RepB/Spo0J family partition protein n=1 Tax=Erythrobacter sp. QSSC1-22B TaxID=1860125 RepID=UPI000804E4F6|nr:ParB/RepB/Spo0J family partition protein [Erythrobacter sp. QSSC1-22B]OBX17918.1 hypothetical protein A9995_14055 [Erythrobacter sp. QSSC1-22B]